MVQNGVLVFVVVASWLITVFVEDEVEVEDEDEVEVEDEVVSGCWVVVVKI